MMTQIDPQRAAELALLLQDGQGDDPRVVEAIVRAYAAPVWGFVSALQNDVKKTEDTIPDVFAQAFQRVDRFPEETSILNWLVSAALFVTGQEKNGSTIPIKENHFLGKILVLPEKQRISIYLRYLSGLSVPDIAQILNTGEDPIHTGLSKARARLSQDENSETFLGHLKHRRFYQQIEATHDGILTEEENSQIASHIEYCEKCQSYDQRLDALETGLRESLRKYFPVQNPTEKQFQEILASLKSPEKIKAQPVTPLFRRELGWIGLVLIGLLAVGAFFTQTTTQEGNPLFPATPTPLPTPLGGNTVSTHIIGNSYYSASSPSISGDGRLVVYASDQPKLVEDDNNDAWDIFVYDQFADTTTRISTMSDGSEVDGNSFNPAISSDGKWVVFHSTSKNLGGITENCPGRDFSCMNVYLHDLQTGKTSLITRPEDNSNTNNDSGMPVISGDGRWILYWSLAGNLVEGDSELCGGEENPANCLDLFVYDRILDKNEKIRIGRQPENLNILSDVSISDDGRMIAVTLIRSDNILDNLRTSNHRDIYLLDRETGSFEIVSLSSTGETGNTESLLPYLTPDGAQILFSTAANNLVENDDNESVDVFARDLISGTVELVSIESSGEQGNNNSGVSLSISPYRVGERIQASENGRWVVFLSSADNLAPSLQPCLYDFPPGCNRVFLHDRETGETLALLQDTNKIFLYPSISRDGRWVVFFEQVTDCYYTCGEIWLYDRETGFAKTLITERIIADQDRMPKWEPETHLEGSLDRITSIDFSPDLAHIATGGNLPVVRVWGLKPESPWIDLTGHEGNISEVQFSPNGEMLASGSFDGTVRIWKMPEGALLYTLGKHPGEVLSLDFSSDGKKIGVGWSQGIHIWEIDEDIFTLTSQFPGEIVNGIVIEPQSEWLAALNGSENTIVIRSVEDGGFLAHLGGHEGTIRALALSDNGTLLASGCEDGVVNIWEVAYQSGKFSAEIRHTFLTNNAVTDVSFSPNGEALFTTRIDGQFQVWDTNEGFLIQTPYQDLVGSERLISVTAADDLSRLAAGSTNGRVHIFSPSGNEPEKKSYQFFLQRSGDQYAEQQLMTNIARREPRWIEDRLDEYYQLTSREFASITDIKVRTPANLPPEAEFLGLDNPNFRVSSLIYKLTTIPDAIFYIFVHQPTGVGEEPLNKSDFPESSLGQSAEIQEIQIRHVGTGNTIIGEFVSGWWHYDLFNTTLDPDVRFVTLNFNVTWSDQEARRTLRWREGDTIYEIIAVPAEADSPGFASVVVRESMFTLAESMLQEFMIADLNCDASPERILISKRFEPPYNGHEIIRVAIEDDHGLQWEITTEDIGSEFFQNPELLRVPGVCGPLLAVADFGSAENSGLKIFRWDGITMTNVLDAKAWRNPDEADLEQAQTISTVRIEYNPSAASCERTTTHYEWDGAAYVTTLSQLEEGVECFANSP